MNIAIRVDASELIGSGHTMRCLTLADQLREAGALIVFICADLPGNMTDYIAQRGFAVCQIIPFENLLRSIDIDLFDKLDYSQFDNIHFTQLAAEWQKDAEATIKSTKEYLNHTGDKLDLLVVDHYSFDIKWETKLSQYTKKMMVIDDLANRSHDCDILLDQNLYGDMHNRYKGLVPEKCRLYLGPHYALLRPEFWKARNNMRKRDGTVKRIFVFFGGADPTNETKKALEAIKMLNRPDIKIDVVVGSSNPQKLKIANICESIPNTEYHCQVDNVAELMVKADLAIGAGGSATWERCSVGLPAITIAIAANQDQAKKDIIVKKSQWNLGFKEKVNHYDIYYALVKLINEKDLLADMADAAFRTMDCYEHEALVKDLLMLIYTHKVM